MFEVFFLSETYYDFYNLPGNDYLEIRRLTLKDPFISESCIEIKFELNFYFHTSFWCLKRFYEGLKAFIKPFEVQQRSVKIKV